MYIASIYALNISFTTLRFTFIVGVNIPESIVNYSGNIVNFWTR